ncbi:MAG: DNA topoisomerase IB [Ardenticatenales bacterium]|nr:DNA topoisomerase IB [Ardenticatenales bacterium]
MDYDSLRPDPEESARAAGLSHVSDEMPGIRRRRQGRGFSYVAPDGTRIADPVRRAALEALAIPPAWTEVWICPDPDGHIQATGRDEKGRKQYRYHPRWQAVRAEAKFERMLAFCEVLPVLRQRVEVDLKRPGLPREKVLACVVRLLETTLIRVGNREYAKNNKHYGLTTMHDRHVEVEGSTIHFSFRGKSGKRHTIHIKDKRLAAIVHACQELPGYELFQYYDETGQCRSIDSGMVNDYLREATGQDITAKDFRTWAGTVTAALVLEACDALESEQMRRQAIAQVVEQVAEQLGNTPTICRQYYIHPRVLDGYLDGTLLNALAALATQEAETLAGLHPDEARVVVLLKALEKNPV